MIDYFFRILSWSSNSVDSLQGLLSQLSMYPYSHAYVWESSSVIICTILYIVLQRIKRGSRDKSRTSDANQDETTDGRKMKPPYLADHTEDEELIGGNPLYLSPPRGSSEQTLTFRVYAPPSFDKEIPKVDFYGAMKFVRTGQVRTFVPTGSRRLLVINFQEMTLSVHMPKVVKESTMQIRKVKRENKNLLFDNDTNNSTERTTHRGHGINISTRRITDENYGRDVSKQEIDDEDVWTVKKFCRKPIIYNLCDLVSVAGVHPRHGGVVQIMSHVGYNTNSGDPFNHLKEENSLEGFLNNADLPPADRRDEFIFQTPRDAAEFQRIVLLLRTSGRDISYLYETLEEMGRLSDDKQHIEELKGTFLSPGVMLEDAWNCFNKIPVLRKGLHQYHLLNEVEDDTDFSIGKTAGYTNRTIFKEKEELADHQQETRTVLGPADFFMLFVPPLPNIESLSAPYSTLCARSGPDCSDFAGRFLTSGVEYHYQNLYFVSALQRLVRRAACYVRAYSQDQLLQNITPSMDKHGSIVPVEKESERQGESSISNTTLTRSNTTYWGGHLKCVPVLKEADEMNMHHNDDVNTIKTILNGMVVPSIKRQFGLSNSDIGRYLIACRHDIIATTVRIVQSAAWRCITFPIDTRLCNIEMKSGQFFQQGCDKGSNPIFYFRNMLLGPWRYNFHATVLYIVHKLDKFLLDIQNERPDVKITVIAFMGHPHENGRRQIEHHVLHDDDESASSQFDTRIDPLECHQLHSNQVIIQLLNELIAYHYPERIAKVLLVPSKDWTKACELPRVHSHPLLTVLKSVDDLKKYVDKEELANIAFAD